MEVVDGVRHDVAGVHRLSERGGDAVHRHAATHPALTCTRTALPDVHRHWEGVAEGDSSKEHLDTDQEVLITSAHCSGPALKDNECD